MWSDSNDKPDIQYSNWLPPSDSSNSSNTVKKSSTYDFDISSIADYDKHLTKYEGGNCYATILSKNQEYDFSSLDRTYISELNYGENYIHSHPVSLPPVCENQSLICPHVTAFKNDPSSGETFSSYPCSPCSIADAAVIELSKLPLPEYSQKMGLNNHELAGEKYDILADAFKEVIEHPELNNKHAVSSSSDADYWRSYETDLR